MPLVINPCMCKPRCATAYNWNMFLWISGHGTRRNQMFLSWINHLRRPYMHIYTYVLEKRNPNLMIFLCLCLYTWLILFPQYMWYTSRSWDSCRRNAKEIEYAGVWLPLPSSDTELVKRIQNPGVVPEDTGYGLLHKPGAWHHLGCKYEETQPGLGMDMGSVE